MNKKIKVTISKEDIYDVQELIDEIKEDPKNAYLLCELHGIEGFLYDAFVDFDSLNQEAKERLIADLATSKSDVDATLSENQYDKFEAFPQFIEEQNGENFCP